MMRTLPTIVMVFVLGGQCVSGAMLCPFCPPASPTLSEQVDESDAVALVRLVAPPTTQSDESAAEQSTLEVVTVLKSFAGKPQQNDKLDVAGKLAGQAGDLFLLMGIVEETDSDRITWNTPEPISEIGFQYLKQAPTPETAKDKRLRYFLKFLEYPDPMLANDAYYEFARAEYAELLLIKESFSREKIRKWLMDPNTLASRTGLYGLMLGLCGNADDVELLKEKILDDADRTRLGIDGVMGGFLLLTGEKGMQLLEDSKIKNPKAPTADVHATMAAFRFLWQYGQGVIPKDRLKSATRQLLDRKDVADLAIADLARWKDWSVQGRLMELYHAGDASNPLGQISTRQAVIRYMIASTLDQPENADLLPHVIQGKKYLEELRKLDPQAVKRCERLMLPR